MSAPFLTRTQAWTLGLAGVGSFMVVLDLFAVSTALSRIRADMHTSVSTLAWTVNAYTLSFAVLIVTAATLGDRWGLVVTGLMLQAGGMAALASLATPDRPYPALAGPLLLVGVGLTLAVPALTKAVVGSVEPGDIGIASGLFTTLRQLGGAFGIAVTATAFAATGGYGSPADVAAGYGGAMYLAAALGLAGAVVAVGTGSAAPDGPGRASRRPGSRAVTFARVDPS